jgi:hypothetical protein
MFISKDLADELTGGKPSYFPASFEKLFSWEDLEQLLNLRPFVNSTRFHVTTGKGYTWENQGWLSDVNTFPPNLLNEIVQEHTCYLSDSSRVNKKVNGVCQELESLFSESSVDAHIYFTLAKNLEGGFGIHYDTSHNLIVQMEGKTRFKLWDVFAKQDDPRNVSEIDESPVYDVILQPGDAVFVPMHSYHQAISQTKRLSVSFPVSFSSPYKAQNRHWIDVRGLLQ